MQLDRFYPDIVMRAKTHRNAPFPRSINESFDRDAKKRIIPVDDTSTTSGHMAKQAHFLCRNFFLAAKIADVSISNISNNTSVWGDKCGELIDLTFIIGANFNNGVGMFVIQGRES